MVTAVPTGLTTLLSAPPTRRSVAQEVDLHQWWSIDEGWHALLRWVRRHPPAGSTLGGGGSAGRFGHRDYPQLSWVDESFHTTGNALNSRLLQVEVATRPSGGLTYLRVDSTVIWYPTRPDFARVPAGVSRVTLTLREWEASGVSQLGPPTTTTDTTVVARLRNLANWLPRALKLTAAESCPAGPWPLVEAVLSFAEGTAPPVARLVTWNGGCPDTAALRLPGHPAIQLWSGYHAYRVAREAFAQG